MVYILLGDGFEEVEAVAPYDILHRGGVQVGFAGVSGRQVTGAHGIEITAGCLVRDISLEQTEMLEREKSSVLPGAGAGMHRRADDAGICSPA